METPAQPVEEALLSKENSTTELDRELVVLDTAETSSSESTSLEDIVS